jgi:hypothetical protein
MDFWKKWQLVIIISQKLLTEPLLIAPKRLRAHSDLTAEVSGLSPAWRSVRDLGLASPRQPIGFASKALLRVVDSLSLHFPPSVAVL